MEITGVAVNLKCFTDHAGKFLDGSGCKDELPAMISTDGRDILIHFDKPVANLNCVVLDMDLLADIKLVCAKKEK